MIGRHQGRVIAYTDGSCIGNPGPGGWGVHAEMPDGRVVELGGGELATTNNRMELRAAIEAVRATTGCASVTVITDSAYIQNGMTRWLSGWKRNGWKTAAGQPVENQKLWIELDGLADAHVTWEWTRAHVGTPGNERCDAIARFFATGIVNLAGDTAPTAARPARNRGSGGSSARYLSLVDGVVERHATWPECERRVRGVRGARFRKARGEEEERAVVEGWGLTPVALVGL